ncbi:MAG: hypothetical protein J2P13_12835 [Acidobacteria bacterium]|nr:hypothetical protein [Acidobacteriota bacterium]
MLSQPGDRRNVQRTLLDRHAAAGAPRARGGTLPQVVRLRSLPAADSTADTVSQPIELLVPFFPGYCFTRIELQWHDIRGCPGVIRVVKAGGDARPTCPTPRSMPCVNASVTVPRSADEARTSEAAS